MRVKINSVDTFGKEYQHEIENVFSIYDDKNEVFIRYMEDDLQNAYRFLKENVISLGVEI